MGVRPLEQTSLTCSAGYDKVKPIQESNPGVEVNKLFGTLMVLVVVIPDNASLKNFHSVVEKELTEFSQPTVVETIITLEKHYKRSKQVKKH